MGVTAWLLALLLAQAPGKAPRLSWDWLATRAEMARHEGGWYLRADVPAPSRTTASRRYELPRARCSVVGKGDGLRLAWNCSAELPSEAAGQLVRVCFRYSRDTEVCSDTAARAPERRR